MVIYVRKNKRIMRANKLMNVFNIKSIFSTKEFHYSN